ncbi:MAG: prepilin peptidase [Vagococcus fluvialis]
MLDMSIKEYLILNCLIFMFGSSLGSFFILVISRVANNQSIVLPKSHCTSCKNKLSWYEIIPVFSWIYLHGKCRKCKTRIPISYVLIESFSGLLMLVCYHLLG